MRNGLQQALDGLYVVSFGLRFLVPKRIGRELTRALFVGPSYWWHWLCIRTPKACAACCPRNGWARIPAVHGCSTTAAWPLRRSHLYN